MERRLGHRGDSLMEAPNKPRRPGYFVTGTDTGVGKTFVSAALARRARDMRPDGRVLAFKPIETGCTRNVGEDQEALAEAAGDWQRGPLRGLYRFRQPAAPLVAAAAQGHGIDIVSIVETFRHGADGTSLAIVEGAGGWRVPITADVDMGGLARSLALPVIVVGRATLGTINHSLLTLEAVERDGCTVAALVLSLRPEEDAAFAASNVTEIRRAWPGRIFVLGSDASALDELLG
jgi:dethiobiotin synthetase